MPTENNGDIIQDLINYLKVFHKLTVEQEYKIRACFKKYEDAQAKAGMKKFDFKKLDTVNAVYGFEVEKWIVKESCGTGIWVTTKKWSKSDSIFLSFARLENDPAFCKGEPISKLRWLLKF